MNRRAGIALVAAAAGWGSLAATTTLALRGLGPMTVLAAELTVAAGVLTAANRLAGRRLPRLSPAIVALGVLEPGVAYLTFNAGVERTSSTHAGLLLGLETVFVVLLATVFLGERPSPASLAALAVAVLGVGLLTARPGGRATLPGDALVLADTLAAAASVVLTARLVRTAPALGLTALQFWVGLVVVLPFCLLTWADGAEPLPARVPVAALLAVLVTGAVGTAGAFLAGTWALHQVGATAAGAAVSLIPVFAVAWSAVVLGEPITTRSLTSVALVLGGLAGYAALGRSAGGSAEPSRSHSWSPSWSHGQAAGPPRTERAGDAQAQVTRI